jgi:ornithine cyclodeaminase/alanine dehydrogenase-like protein (mu-crystallin family)
MADLKVLNHGAVLAAVTPGAAIERVRDAFLRHHRGEWVMPAKVYLQSPPYGDFRAMPARGGGYAMLKWISSFPGNPAAHGLPAVMGVVCVSDAST